MENTPERIMKVVFDLAINGTGYVEPNPVVGAIITKNGSILSTGYHRYFGGPHAEIDAISKVLATRLKGAHLYINLEPCCHHDKKTPPCLDKILTLKFKEIYIANIDPNPAVKGKTIKILKDKGYKVNVGILEEEGRFLNRAFYKSIREKIPYVVLKAAITYDNKIGILNRRVTISSTDAITYAKQSRDEFNAVLIGARTLSIDNPALLPLSKKLDVPKTFYRIIISTRNPTILLHKKIINTVDEFHPLIFAQIGNHINIMVNEVWEPVGLQITNKFLSDKINYIKIIKVKNLYQLLKVLYSRYNIGKLLVEGGGATFRSFYYAGLFDEIHLYISNKKLPDKNALYLTEKPQSCEEFTEGMKLYETKRFTHTTLLKFYKN